MSFFDEDDAKRRLDKRTATSVMRGELQRLSNGRLDELSFWLIWNLMVHGWGLSKSPAKCKVRALMNQLFVPLDESSRYSVLLLRGWRLFHGYGINQNQEVAFATFMAGKNDPSGRCQAMIGFCHRFGRGTPINEELATLFITQSSELGCADGILSHGYLLADGACGLPRNVSRAAQCFERAQRRGSVEAMYMAATWAQSSSSGDIVRAVHLFKAAWARGDTESYQHLKLIGKKHPKLLYPRGAWKPVSYVHVFVSDTTHLEMNTLLLLSKRCLRLPKRVLHLICLYIACAPEQFDSLPPFDNYQVPASPVRLTRRSTGDISVLMNVGAPANNEQMSTTLEELRGVVTRLEHQVQRIQATQEAMKQALHEVVCFMQDQRNNASESSKKKRRKK